MTIRSTEPDLDGALDAVDSIELGRELSQLARANLGVDGVAFGAQPLTFGGFGLLDALVERRDLRVGARPVIDLPREHDGGRRRAPDHGGVGAFDRARFEVLVQRAGEHHERAAVEARDHAEHDRSVEVDDGARDLGAIFELQPAHRLR